jgi:hypothetical protein
MAKKKVLPKFSIGDKVVSNMTGNDVLIISEVWHNGFTNMYSFEGQEMSCGEMYLQRLSPNNNYDAYMKEIDRLTN